MGINTSLKLKHEVPDALNPKTVFHLAAFYASNKQDFLHDITHDDSALIIINPLLDNEVLVTQIYDKIVRPMIKYSGLRTIVNTLSWTNQCFRLAQHCELDYKYVFILGDDRTVYDFIQGLASRFKEKTKFLHCLQTIQIGHIPSGSMNALPISLGYVYQMDPSELLCPFWHTYRLLLQIEHQQCLTLNLLSLHNFLQADSPWATDYLWDYKGFTWGFIADNYFQACDMISDTTNAQKKANKYFYAIPHAKKALIHVELATDHNCKISTGHIPDWTVLDNHMVELPPKDYIMLHVCNIPWLWNNFSVCKNLDIQDREWIALAGYNAHSKITQSKFKILMKLFRDGNLKKLLEDKNFFFLPVRKIHIMKQTGDLLLAGKKAKTNNVEIGHNFLVSIEGHINFL